MYLNTTVKSNPVNVNETEPHSYHGLSTVSDSKKFVLHDISLIKQDIVNHFHIRQGDKLENPEFGCVIWDLLFDQLTDNLRALIAQNVEEIINYDPRVRVDSIVVSQSTYGITAECELTYLNYNISEQLKFDFDSRNNFLS